MENTQKVPIYKQKKILIPGVLLFAIASVIAAAIWYNTATAEITVNEALSAVPLTYTVSAFPGETKIYSINVTNAASVPLNTYLNWTESSNPAIVTYTTNLPITQLTVPGLNVINVSFTIKNDSTIGVFNGTITLFRIP